MSPAPTLNVHSPRKPSTWTWAARFGPITRSSPTPASPRRRDPEGSSILTSTEPPSFQTTYLRQFLGDFTVRFPSLKLTWVCSAAATSFLLAELLGRTSTTESARSLAIISVLPDPMSIDTDMGAGVLKVGIRTPWGIRFAFEVGRR